MNTPDANPAETRVSILGWVGGTYDVGFKNEVVSTLWVKVDL